MANRLHTSHAELSDPVARVIGLVVLGMLVGLVVAFVVPGMLGAARGCGDPALPTYQVAAGDSWFAIADRAGVPGAELLALNGADAGDAIHVGDVLCLPPGSSPVCSGASYTVKRGDSWSAIAAGAGASLSGVLAANGAQPGTAIYPGDTLCLPSGAAAPSATRSSGGGSNGYTVGAGDSWFAIADRVGVSMSALLDANGASTRTVLTPGETIALPAGASAVRWGGAVDLEAMPVRPPCGYANTWLQDRPGGRRHEGVDIIAGEGQYVYAVVDGTLFQRGWDQPGRRSGNSWWLRSDDGSRTSFFYAHLLDFAPNLRVGQGVSAGEIIGFVGETGNASVPHLHFEVHPGGGEGINPYPILRNEGACRTSG